MKNSVKYFFEDFGPFIVGALAALTFFVGFVFSVNGLAHHFDGSRCAQFGQISGRQVKFVDYNIFSWECLVNTSNGWIDLDNVGDVGVK